MYRLNLTTTELVHVQKAIWSYWVKVTNDDYDAYTSKTQQRVWEKLTKTGKTVANLGAWTMKNYELCLFGTKGSMLKHKQVNNIYQKVAAERTKHSKKPNEVRIRIEKLFGDLPQIELFAREKVKGWDCWGDEVIND